MKVVGLVLEVLKKIKIKNKNKKSTLQNGLSWREKISETRMTASFLKQDPNTRKVQKNAIY